MKLSVLSRMLLGVCGMLLLFSCEQDTPKAISLQQLTDANLSDIQEIAITTNTKEALLYASTAEDRKVEYRITFNDLQSFEAQLHQKLSSYPNIEIVYHRKDNSMFSMIFSILPILLLVVLVLYIYCLVKILTGTFQNSNDKLMWVLLVLFLPFFGSILYLMIGSKQRIS